jgi:hypothetical protein
VSLLEVIKEYCHATDDLAKTQLPCTNWDDITLEEEKEKERAVQKVRAAALRRLERAKAELWRAAKGEWR